MTLLELFPEALNERIGVQQVAYRERWIPAEHPGRHWIEDVKGLGTYVRTKDEFVDGVLKNIPLETGVSADRYLLTGVCFALENALLWGHNCDLTLPLQIEILAGTAGAIVRLEDSGGGFPYQERIRQYHARERWYQRGGTAFYVFDAPVFDVAYQREGNVINFILDRGYCQERTRTILQKRAEKRETLWRRNRTREPTDKPAEN